MPIHRLRLGDERADISSYGGQLLSWRSGSREQLFLSPRACFKAGQAIRGGVPVIFPQFNARGPFGRHGFARLQEWHCCPLSEAALQLQLEDSDSTRAQWPYRFGLQLEIRLAAHAIALELLVENRDSKPFQFTAALHSYLALDFADACVHGLGDAGFEAQGRWYSPERQEPLRPRAPIDRIYTGGSDQLRVQDDHQQIEIAREGFSDWVLWNPGPQTATALDDLGAGQAARFLCIEPGQILQPATLLPGECWRAALRLRTAAVDRSRSR